jgi:hypothetical protein
MQVLTQPDTSTDITRAGKLIGHIVCLNINPPHQPPAIRWHGKQPGDAASGQARLTQAEAAQDVADWAAGKSPAYEQHAVVEKAGMFTASACGANAGCEECRTKSNPNLL